MVENEEQNSTLSHWEMVALEFSTVLIKQEYKVRLEQKNLRREKQCKNVLLNPKG